MDLSPSIMKQCFADPPESYIDLCIKKRIKMSPHIMFVVRYNRALKLSRGDPFNLYNMVVAS